MIIAATVLATSFQTVDFFLEAIVQAQSAVRKEHITATALTFADGRAAQAVYNLDIDRLASVHMTVQNIPETARPQIFFYRFGQRNASAVVVDTGLQQYTRSLVPEARSFGPLAAKATPQLDEFVMLLGEPQGLQAFLTKIPPPDQWTWSREKNQIVLSHRSQELTAAIAFPPRNPRPTRIAFQNKSGTIEWKFRYAPFKNLPDPSKKSGVFEVASFDPNLAAPKPQSQSARALLDRALARNEPAVQIAYQTKEAGQQVTVRYSPTRVYQKDSVAEWTYDGRQLRIFVPRTNTLYVGEATHAQLIDAVANAGTRVETNLRSLIAGKNPFRAILAGATTVNDNQRAKLFKPKGETPRYLTARVPAAEITLVVSPRDGFVLGVESAIYDQYGRPTGITTLKEFQRLPQAPVPTIPNRARPTPLARLLAQTP